MNLQAQRDISRKRKVFEHAVLHLGILHLPASILVFKRYICGLMRQLERKGGNFSMLISLFS